MIIRQDFHDQPELPPRLYLEQIMDLISKVYVFLWDHKDPENKYKTSWKDISKYFNKNTFRTGLRTLNDKGLLSYNEDDEGIAIELVGWDSVASDMY